MADETARSGPQEVAAASRGSVSALSALSGAPTEALRTPRRLLFPSYPRPIRKRLRAHYHALEAQLGPFQGRVWDLAWSETTLWWTWREVDAELAAVRSKREQKRGRRPSAWAVERLRKRQGLAWQSWTQAVALLEDAVAKRKPASIAELVAERRAGA